MVDNPTFLRIMAKERQQAFEREARLVRLRHLARMDQPGLTDRMVVKLADTLISTGQKIKKRACERISCRRKLVAAMYQDAEPGPFA